MPTHTHHQAVLPLVAAALLSLLTGCCAKLTPLPNKHALASTSASMPAPDITEQLENLGIPYAAHYPNGDTTYARNPWDLHAHQGHLYIGAGNSSNGGPAVNAGPVPIIRFNPKTDTTQTIFTIDDEQIDLFYTFNNTLYIPGHDATESWELGNIYLLDPTPAKLPNANNRENLEANVAASKEENQRKLQGANGESNAGGNEGRWVKHRTVPQAVHVYAMAWHEGQLFAGGSIIYKDDDGKQAMSSTAFVSDDQGQTWTTHKLGMQRIHTLMTVGNKLFAIDIPKNKQRRDNWMNFRPGTIPTVFEYLGRDQGFRAREDIRFEQLLPDHNTYHRHFAQGKLVKPVSLGNQTAYIGAVPHNDHQYFPLGLYIAQPSNDNSIAIQRATLPAPPEPTQELLVWDLMKQGNTLYALAAYQDDNHWVNTVYTSTDALQWTALLQFRSSTFARSFERMGSDWYFALGCEITHEFNWSDRELHPATGTLLRYRTQ